MVKEKKVKYTCSLTLTVELDMDEDSELDPDKEPEVRYAALQEFEKRIRTSDYDGDSLGVELE